MSKANLKPPMTPTEAKAQPDSLQQHGSADGWIDALEQPPEQYEWPIIAYFGSACKGCKGPCVMLSNWNDTFTHWQRLSPGLLHKALGSIPMPNPPNAELRDAGESVGKH